MAEAQVRVVANPLINLTLQGRHDTYPKRRGMTRVPELMAAGLTVAFGQDCVMDPWYPLGQADLLDAAAMAVHAAPMTSLVGMRSCFDAVTVNAARVLGLDGDQGRGAYGLAPGCRADLVLLQARDPIEALRLRPARLLVMRGGRVLARTPRVTSALSLPGRPASVERLQRAPAG